MIWRILMAGTTPFPPATPSSPVGKSFSNICIARAFSRLYNPPLPFPSVSFSGLAAWGPLPPFFFPSRKPLPASEGGTDRFFPFLISLSLRVRSSGVRGKTVVFASGHRREALWDVFLLPSCHPNRSPLLFPLIVNLGSSAPFPLPSGWEDLRYFSEQDRSLLFFLPSLPPLGDRCPIYAPPLSRGDEATVVLGEGAVFLLPFFPSDHRFFFPLSAVGEPAVLRGWKEWKSWSLNRQRR